MEEEDEDEGVSSQLTLQALAGNLQRMNSLWGPQEARSVRILFFCFSMMETLQSKTNLLDTVFSNAGPYTVAAVHNILDADLQY